MLKRKATDFSCLVLAWVFVAAAGIFSQAAAADPAYLAEFKLHSEAVANGDRAAAAEHGKAAWEAAEAALGDGKLTATLAFNYGRLIALADPATALAPLRRAQELLDAGIADLPRSEVRAYLAYADYIAGKSPHARKAARELQEALLALEVETGGPAGEDIVMWLELAKGELAKKRYRRSLEAAEKAEAAIAIFAPDNIDKMGEALLLQGVAALLPTPKTTKNVLAAHVHFERAKRLFPPQKDFESFDPTFALAIAWGAATDAVILSMRKKPRIPSINNDDDTNASPPPPAFETAIDAPEDCGIKWAKRKSPSYPASAGMRGYVGAVMVVFDLGDDLIARNPRILTEVPVNTFSKAVLKSIPAWRLEAPSVDHPGCRQNIMTQITFVNKF